MFHTACIFQHLMSVCFNAPNYKTFSWYLFIFCKKKKCTCTEYETAGYKGINK